MRTARFVSLDDAIAALEAEAREWEETAAGLRKQAAALRKELVAAREAAHRKRPGQKARKVPVVELRVAAPERVAARRSRANPDAAPGGLPSTASVGDPSVAPEPAVPIAAIAPANVAASAAPTPTDQPPT